MEEVTAYGENVRNDFSGTLQKPVLVSKIPGKNGRGAPLLMKVEDKIYQVNRHQKRRKWDDYRCKSGENRSKGTKCPWRCRVDDKFQVIANPKAKEHTCQPISGIKRQGENLYRDYVRKKFSEGCQSLSDIKLWLVSRKRPTISIIPE